MKVKPSKKAAAEQNPAPVPAADKSNDQAPAENTLEDVKEENSQQEAGEQKVEKPKKIKKKVCCDFGNVFFIFGNNEFSEIFL